MFNAQKFSTRLNINAVAGTLVKNHHKSRFVVCKSDSHVFDESGPYLNVSEWNEVTRDNRCVKKDVVVLQAMIIGERLFLCEVVELEDFESSLAEDSR